MHAPPPPELRSAEEWPGIEPAALIRSSCSGPQPLLVALAGSQFGQVNNPILSQSDSHVGGAAAFGRSCSAGDRLYLSSSPLVLGTTDLSRPAATPTTAQEDEVYCCVIL